MSRSLSVYIQRITPWQATPLKQNFLATVSGVVAPAVDAGAVAESLPLQFDLDTAVGAQLDVTGKWIGPSRNVSLPIAQAYFSFDVAGVGFDQGAWKGPYSGEYGIYQLDDETYRRLLYSVIMANHWDGTIPGAQAVYDTFFTDPATLLFIQDNAQVSFPVAFFSFDTPYAGFDQGVWAQATGGVPSVGNVDVSMTVAIAGKIPPPLYLGLLAQGAIPIKPGGVQVDYAVTSVDGAPLFGFDVKNDYVSGFDTGAFGVDPNFLLNA